MKHQNSKLESKGTIDGKKIIIAICLMLLGLVIGFFVGRSSVQEQVDKGSVSENKIVDNDESDSEEVGLPEDETEELQDKEGMQETADNLTNSEDISGDNDEESDEKDKYELPEF